LIGDRLAPIGVKDRLMARTMQLVYEPTTTNSVKLSPIDIGAIDQELVSDDYWSCGQATTRTTS
jgi:hypothetical protein